MVESKPKAGFFVQRRHKAIASPTLTQFKSQISTPSYTGIDNNGIPDGPLGISSTPLDNQALSDIDRCFKRCSKRIGQRLNQYPDRQGELMLRQALSDHFYQQGFGFTPQNVVVTHGGMSAVKTALESCTQAGDTVAISSPCFSGLLEIIHQMRLRVVEIPSTKEGVDLEQFEFHLRNNNIQAGLFCTSHMNPQGINMSADQKRKLAYLAAKYQTPVIEDDVYVELSHNDEFPLPAKHYDTEGYILWCGSVSKTLSPAYRLGWCLPGRYLQSYISAFSTASYGVALPIQVAIADFIDSGLYGKYVKRKRTQLLQQKHQYTDFLRQHLPLGSKISSPKGGLVLWVQVPGLTSEALSNASIAKQLDIRAGKVFTSLPLYGDCFRVNMGHPFSPDVKQELEKLITVIEQAQTHIIEPSKS